MGRDQSGFANVIPISIASATIARGREAYQRNCGICHGSPDSKGGEVVSSTVPITTLSSLAPGYLFERTITEKNTLAAYGPQITVPDRWAIVAFLKHGHSQRSAGIQR
jgi:mono/diheme cytochrome c family protein